MPFDGVDYGGSSMIFPRAHHSGAIAVPDVAYDGLKGAYFFSKTHARHIGHQTYKSPMDLPSNINATDRSFLRLTFVELTVMRRFIPVHCTHIDAYIFFQFARTGQASHRIRVDDGSTFLTGATVVTQSAGLGNPVFRNPGVYPVFSPYDELNISNAQAVVTVAVTSAVTPKTVNIAVEGFAEDPDNTAAPYIPQLISVAWRSSG